MVFELVLGMLIVETFIGRCKPPKAVAFLPLFDKSVFKMA